MLGLKLGLVPELLLFLRRPHFFHVLTHLRSKASNFAFLLKLGALNLDNTNMEIQIYNDSNLSIKLQKVIHEREHSIIEIQKTYCMKNKEKITKKFK